MDPGKMAGVHRDLTARPSASRITRRPVGFLITAGLVGIGMAVSLWPPARSGLLGLLTWLVSAIPNESPFLALYWLGASTLLAVSQAIFTGPGCGLRSVSPPRRSPARRFSSDGVCAQPPQSSRHSTVRSGRGGDTQELGGRSHRTRLGDESCSRRCPCYIPV